jgi:SAM-dependent methyltransferase
LETRYADGNRRRYADLYEGGYFTAEERYAQFLRRFKPGTIRILDVGCNRGRGGEFLKRHASNFEIYGLDCVCEWVDALDPRSYAGGYCTPSETVPVADAFFDAIVAGEFIEHLTYADALATLSEFRRILRPGGQLMLTTPNPHYIRLALSGRSIVADVKRSQYTPKQLIVQLAKTGFEAFRIRGSGKATRLLGERFRPLTLYGSYLLECSKADS